MSEKYLVLRSYHTEQFIKSIDLQKDKSSKRYGFRHGYDCGFKVMSEQLSTLTAKVKRYEEALIKIQDGGVPCGVQANPIERMLTMCELARAALTQTSEDKE